MTKRQYLTLKHLTVGSILLLGTVNANEQIIESDKAIASVYLSSLENKIEEIRNELQVQQKRNVKIEESLAQIKQINHEIQNLKEQLNKDAKESLLPLQQKIDKLDQQRSQLIQSHQNLLSSLNEKASKTEVDHSLNELSSQIEQLKNNTVLSSSTSKMDQFLQTLSQAEREVKQLKIDFNELTQQKSKTEEMEKSLVSLRSEVSQVRDNLSKVQSASIAQEDRMGNIEQEQQTLNKKVIASNQDSYWEVRFTADFLYWHQGSEGLEFASQGNPSENFYPNNTTNPFLLPKLKIHKVNPGYHAGYRVSEKLNFPYDHWNINLVWTGYSNKARNSFSSSPSQLIWPYLLNNKFDPVVTQEAKAKYRLHLNCLDLDLQKLCITAGKHFSMEPFVGFRGAWIDNHFTAKYRGINFANSLVLSSGAKASNKYSFSGYGLHSGMNTKFSLPYDLSIFASGAFSMLWGKSTFHGKEEIKDSPTGKSGKIHYRTDNLRPVIAWQAGIQWEVLLRNRYSINLHAGWEQQIWFNQILKNNFYNNQMDGYVGIETCNLSLSGFTGGVTFGF